MSSELDEYTTATKKLKSSFDIKETKLYESDVHKSGLTLPGHKYEGPGNSVNLGQPTNKADAVSQLHDTEYFDAQYKFKEGKISRGEFNQNVKDSDSKAITNFAKTRSIGGVLGAVGLGTKKFAENFTKNPIYPNPGNSYLKWLNNQWIFLLLG